MGSSPNIEVLVGPEDLAQKALQVLFDVVREGIASRGVFFVAIPGGRTPRRFFEHLGQSVEARALQWDKVHLFWTDERYVSPDHQDSNYKLAADTFLARIPIPGGNIHRVPTELPSSCDAVRSYEQTMREVFQVHGNQIPHFDLIVLGMGTDGHTASLFPYSYAVTDTEALVCTVHRPEGPCRITLTVPVLRAARRIVVLVSGQDKAQIVNQVLTGGTDPQRYPIQVLWPVLDRVLWLVDQKAASIWDDRYD